MPLEIYKRRHAIVCLQAIQKRVAAGQMRPLDFKGLQQYDRCDCAWWVRGTTDRGEIILQRSLKIANREDALEAVRILNERGSTGVPKKGRIETKHDLTKVYNEWMDVHHTRYASDGTVTNYGKAFKHLARYAQANDKVFVSEILPQDLNALRLEWKKKQLQLSTQRVYWTILRHFFAYCMRMDYLRSNPSDKVEKLPKLNSVKLPDGRKREEATLPLDAEGDDNYRKIMDGLDGFVAERLKVLHRYPTWGRRSHMLRHPESFRALLELMYETGLRISDATMFEPARMVVDGGGGVYSTMQIKTNWPVTCFIEPWLAQKLLSLRPIDNGGKYPFYDGVSDRDTYINDNVRRLLGDLGDAVGVPDVRPHRFRDSFAVNALNRGLLMEEVSKLLGHKSILMTERYYAPFVKSREVALRKRVKATLPAQEPAVQEPAATGTTNVVPFRKW